MTEQTPEVPKTETPATPETPQATPKNDEMSAKFAALAKKERFIRTTHQSIKAKEAALAERERQLAEREKAWEEEFKASPLEAIKKRGYSYQDLTNAALNDGKLTPETEIKSVKQEIERLRQEQAEREQKALEHERLAAEQQTKETIETFKESLRGFISSNPEKYELTNRWDANGDLVFQTIEEHFNRTQKVMSKEEAADLVEQYFETELEETSKTKKFQSKFGQALKKEEQPKPKSTTTISNGLAPSSSAPSLLPAHTESDRIKRALAALG